MPRKPFPAEPWKPFNAEAIELDTRLRKLHQEGRTSEALLLIAKTLERAYRDGPSNITYEEFALRGELVKPAQNLRACYPEEWPMYEGFYWEITSKLEDEAE